MKWKNPCQSVFLQWFEWDADDNLQHIITMDETLMYHYDPETIVTMQVGTFATPEESKK